MMITKKKRRRRRKREKQFGYRRFSQRALAGGLVFLSPLLPFPGFWIICFTKEDGKEREKWMQAGRVASGRIDFKGTNFEGVGGEREDEQRKRTPEKKSCLRPSRHDSKT